MVADSDFRPPPILLFQKNIDHVAVFVIERGNKLIDAWPPFADCDLVIELFLEEPALGLSPSCPPSR